jgi:HEPN domain-containing protein/predicted nucleotidyltransferase
MKTTLTHLPPAKQQELTAITNAIVEIEKPVMVILFGSHSRGDWVEDKYTENGTTYEYRSDYDILVITKKDKHEPPGFTKSLRRKLQRSLKIETPITVIFHDIDFVNAELEQGHYFFADIAKEGTMLYDNGKHTLSTAKQLQPGERAKKAQLYFESWLNDANEFFDVAKTTFESGKPKVAIFILHQATERYFMTVLLVFTDYKPKIHDLEDLYRQVTHADARFKTVFPNQTEEEKRMFTVLRKAYIDSRYKLEYTVSPEDLKWLIARVQELRTLTKGICEGKIERYKNT